MVSPPPPSHLPLRTRLAECACTRSETLLKRDGRSVDFERFDGAVDIRVSALPRGGSEEEGKGVEEGDPGSAGEEGGPGGGREADVQGTSPSFPSVQSLPLPSPSSHTDIASYTATFSAPVDAPLSLHLKTGACPTPFPHLIARDLTLLSLPLYLPPLWTDTETRRLILSAPPPSCTSRQTEV